MSSVENYQVCTGARVSIVTIDGEELAGEVYLKKDQRLLDMLNDPRGFIGIEDFTNDKKRFRVVSKSIISIITPVNQQKPKTPGSQHDRS